MKITTAQLIALLQRADPSGTMHVVKAHNSDSMIALPETYVAKVAMVNPKMVYYAHGSLTENDVGQNVVVI